MPALPASVVICGRLVRFDEDLAVGGHPRLRVAGRAAQDYLDADHLLDAVVAEVRVLGRERGLGVYARDDCVDGLVGRGVEEDLRALARADAAYLAFGDEAAKVDGREVDERYE